jgi:large subunit ribosomal protein L9
MMVQLVLLERIPKLGVMGDIVNVKPGYARNFLLPQKKALRASEGNIKKFELERKDLEAQNLQTKKEAESAKSKIDGRTFIIIRSASDSGSLYGSVTSRDAEEAMKEEGLIVNRKQIILIKPIKDLGLHELLINLHPEVNATIDVNVARSAEEAEIQKSGKTIQDAKMEADADADFDIAELFDDVGSAAIVDDDLDKPSADSADDSEELK